MSDPHNPRPPQDLEQLEPSDVIAWLKANPSILMEISMTFQLGLAVGSLTALGRTKEWIHNEVDDVISAAEKAKEDMIKERENPDGQVP